MKIIAGSFRGRVIESFKDKRYRPTKSFNRESIFNILNSLEMSGHSIINGGAVLDLFTGSGILSFEAVSRGAAHAVLVDQDRSTVELIQRNIDKLGLNDKMNVIRSDVNMLRQSFMKYNLIFMDPPYKSSLVDKTLCNISERGYIAENAIIIIETSKFENIKYADCFNLETERIYGETKVYFLKYSQKNEEE